MMRDELNQSVKERNQRMRIGAGIAAVAVLMSLCLLLALWFFLYSIPKDGSESVWRFAAVAFSAVHIAVVALLFALIKGMFGWKKEDGLTFSALGEIKFLLDKFRGR